MVIAPEHPLLPALTAPEQQEAVQAYVAAATSKSDLQRTELQKSKTGVPTGERGACRMGKHGVCPRMQFKQALHDGCHHESLAVIA